MERGQLIRLAPKFDQKQALLYNVNPRLHRVCPRLMERWKRANIRDKHYDFSRREVRHFGEYELYNVTH